MLYYPVHPVLSDKRWFDVVQPHRSHLEPTRTPVKLPCTPGSPIQMVAQESSKELNHPELMSYDPVHPVPSFKRWLEQVRRGWTTPKSFGTNPNLCQTTLYIRFPQSSGVSSRFKGVEPPRSHLEPTRTPVKLPCTPGSPIQMVAQESSKELNHPELMSYDPVHPVPSFKRWLEQVRRGWTTPKSFGTNPNLCQTTLYIRFPQSSGVSSRFKGVEPPQSHLEPTRTHVILMIMHSSYWPSYRSLCYHPTDHPTDDYATILLTVMHVFCTKWKVRAGTHRDL